MKKIYSLVLIAVFATAFLTANAQEKPEKFGIRGGYQLSTWNKNGTQLQGTDALNSFYAGLFKDNKILPALHFGVGFEYFQNGYKINSSNKRVLHYLSLPLYLKAKIGPAFALAGFGANLKVAEKIFVNDQASNPTDEQKSKVVDFPFLLGVGAKFRSFTMEARYHWGLSDINNGAHNQYFQIGAGISF